MPINPAERARAVLSAAIVATARRDRAAFRQVYDLSSAKLFGICLRICVNRQAAEDVLNEVYHLIWRRAITFEPGPTSPITWLATIARNRAVDWRRANPVRNEVAVALIDNVSDCLPTAFDRLEQANTLARLHIALAALGHCQREAIKAAFLEGLTYPELAAREGVPLSTMKSRIRRGLHCLKVSLIEHEDCASDPAGERTVNRQRADEDATKTIG